MTIKIYLICLLNRPSNIIITKMSSSIPLNDIQVGDYIDLETHNYQPRIVVQVTPQGLQLKDPLALNLDPQFYSLSKIKPFRTLTKLKESSNLSVGVIRRPKLPLQQIQQLSQILKDITVDPLAFSPKQLIQILRGRHYYFSYSLILRSIQAESAYQQTIEYLSLHRQLFIKYLLAVDFAAYPQTNIYESSMSALCSAYPEMMELIDIGTGLAPECADFKKSIYYKKEIFEQQVHEWLESQFLLNFVEAKHTQFPAQLVILLMMFVWKLVKALQLSLSEPLSDFFQTMYKNLLNKIETQNPPNRQIAAFFKYAPNIFKLMFGTDQNFESGLPKNKGTDSSQTEKLQSDREEPDHTKNSQNKMVEEEVVKQVKVEGLSKDQFAKIKEIELRSRLALSYLRHGSKQSCFTQLNLCLADIVKECKVKEQIAHLPENWPKIGVQFLAFIKESKLMESLLSISNFPASSICVRTILLKFYPFLPKQVSVACIKSGKASVLKQVLTQKTTMIVREDIFFWLFQYLAALKVEESSIKEVNELIKYLQNWLKGKPTFSQCNLHREVLIWKQFELAQQMKTCEFSIFENVVSLNDEVKIMTLKKYMQENVLCRMEVLLEHFNEHLLNIYVKKYMMTIEQFEKMMRPILLKEKDRILYQRRQDSIITVLHFAFDYGTCKVDYFEYLDKFIDYYCNLLHDKSLAINCWNNFDVLPQTPGSQSQRLFFEACTEAFCLENLPKLLPLVWELDIKLWKDLFIKFNHLKGNILIDFDKSDQRVVRVPLFMEELMTSFYNLGKDEIKTQQKILQNFFVMSTEEVYSQMLQLFLKVILNNQAACNEVNQTFRKLKARFPQLKSEKSDGAEYKLKFFNMTVLKQFDEWLKLYQNDPCRKMIADDEINNNTMLQVKGNQTLEIIKIKLAHKINREPCEIIFLDKESKPLPLDVEKRYFGVISSFFLSEGDEKDYKNKNFTITFVIQPQKSRIHQCLLNSAVKLFKLLPKTNLLLQGIDMRIEPWQSFDKTGEIANEFEKVVKEASVPEAYKKLISLSTYLLDYFLWRKKEDQLKNYDFCCLLTLSRKIESEDDCYHNLKIVYLIYLSKNFKIQSRDELLQTLLLDQTGQLKNSGEQESDCYKQLVKLVFDILQDHSKGALQYYFTTKMLQKLYESEAPFYYFKSHWRKLYQNSTFYQKIEIFDTLEERVMNNPENIRQLGSLIEEQIDDSDLTQMYETCLQKMARFVVMLNKTKPIGNNLKTSKILLNNCWEFVEKDIKCDYLFHQQFLNFLRDNFYDYAYYIPNVLYGLFAHVMEQRENKRDLLIFFRNQIIEEEWQKKESLEGGRKYREPQAQGYVGLVNCFNTCYANSLFQQMFHNEWFCRQLLAADWSRKVKEDEDLMLQLKKIFIHLKQSQEPYENKEFFDYAFKLCDGLPVETTIQMDVDEFKNLLFNHMQEILPKNMFWSKIFEGKQQSQIKCLECQNISTTEQTFNSICLSVQDFTDLESSLQDHHKPLILEKDNAYSCQKCNKKVRAEKSLSIKAVPPCLIFVLKRFQYIADKGFRRKLNNYFEFPMAELEWEDGHMYTLKGIISHVGYSESGHYISYVKIKGQWYEFNDQRVRQLSEQDVKLNSYGTLRGSQKSMMTERTAYLLFYQSIEHPTFMNEMQTQDRVVGVQRELQLIRLEKRLTNKEIAYFNYSFINFLVKVCAQDASEQALHLLFTGLIQIGFKIKFSDVDEAKIYQEQLVYALKIVAKHQASLPFLWHPTEVQKIVSIINTPILLEYKAALAYLLALNCTFKNSNAIFIIDFCLENIYDPKIDASALYVFLHNIAKKFEWAAQRMHQQRAIGRILDLTFVNLVNSTLRGELKQGVTVPFEKSFRVEASIVKEELRYHKWALLVLLLQKYMDKLHESEFKYLTLQYTSLTNNFIKRVLDEARTKAVMHFISKFLCLLSTHLDYQFTKTLMETILDGLRIEKGEGLKRYFVALEQLLALKDKHQEDRNLTAVTICMKILQIHNNASDNSFQYAWLWLLKICNGNQLFRNQIASKKTMFDFLLFKSYTNSSFWRAERNNNPPRTRQRLYGLPIPLYTKDYQTFHSKKIENTKAVLNRSTYPAFVSEKEQEEETVDSNIEPHSTILRFNDFSQQFEEYKVYWIIGDLIALKDSIPKEKYPHSVLLLRGDERVKVKKIKDEKKIEKKSSWDSDIPEEVESQKKI